MTTAKAQIGSRGIVKGTRTPQRELSGVDPVTVMRDTAGVESATPERTTGRDGKSYPATRPKPAPVLDFPEQPTQASGVTRREVERVEKRENRPAPKPVEFVEGAFPVLYADPPWRYEVPGGQTPDLRAVENHYPSMSVEEICDLPVPAADDAVLGTPRG